MVTGEHDLLAVTAADIDRTIELWRCAGVCWHVVGTGMQLRIEPRGWGDIRRAMLCQAEHWRLWPQKLAARTFGERDESASHRFLP